MLQDITLCHSLCLNNIPLYGYLTFCLSVHRLIDIWIVTILGSYEQCYHERLHASFCMDIHFQLSWVCRSGIVGSCGHCMFHFLRNYPELFSKANAWFSVSSRNKWGFQFLCILAILLVTIHLFGYRLLTKWSIIMIVSSPPKQPSTGETGSGLSSGFTIRFILFWDHRPN